MKHLWILVVFSSLLILSPGCAKKDADKRVIISSTDRFVGGREKNKSGSASRGDPLKAGDGVIKGRVVLQGDKPAVMIVSSMAAHNDSAVCLAGSEFEKIGQQWLIGEKIGDKYGVANVVVSLKPPAGKYFEYKKDDKKNKVVLDQPHCAFVPHVVGIFPQYWDGKGLQDTGEEFIVKNSATINHNTKWQGDPLKNPLGTKTLPSKDEMPVRLVPQSDPIQISCDIHPWMYARVWAFEHPYFAVTDDKGEFEIKNVPTGVDLGVVAWHERSPTSSTVARMAKRRSSIPARTSWN